MSLRFISRPSIHGDGRRSGGESSNRAGMAEAARADQRQHVLGRFGRAGDQQPAAGLRIA